jgi:gamma-glutamylaminecyclotransferase
LAAPSFSAVIARVPLLFVYGTFCRGARNHAQMDGARLVGPARTAATFTLVDLGPYPALVAGGGDAVAGEVYDITAAHRARLDEFEEHPAFYERATIRLEDGRDVDAYLLPADRLPSER